MKKIILFLIIISTFLCSCAKRPADQVGIPEQPADKEIVERPTVEKTEEQLQSEQALKTSYLDYGKSHIKVTHRENGDVHELEGDDAKYICWLFDNLYYDIGAVCKCDEGRLCVSTGEQDISYYVSFTESYVRKLSDGKVVGQHNFDDEQEENVRRILFQYE